MTGSWFFSRVTAYGCVFFYWLSWKSLCLSDSTSNATSWTCQVIHQSIHYRSWFPCLLHLHHQKNANYAVFFILYIIPFQFGSKCKFTHLSLTASRLPILFHCKKLYNRYFFKDALSAIRRIIFRVQPSTAKVHHHHHLQVGVAPHGSTKFSVISHRTLWYLTFRVQ